MISEFDKLCNKILSEKKNKAGKEQGVDGKACWKGYRRQGTKKKGGKTVDNCVKIKEASDDKFAPCDHCNQPAKCEAAGKCLRGGINEENAKCTGPTKKASSTRKGKTYMKCVKRDSGGYKRIHWGQKGAKAGSGNSKRKKAFRARHKCSTAKSNTPRGQACKDW